MLQIQRKARGPASGGCWNRTLIVCDIIGQQTEELRAVIQKLSPSSTNSSGGKRNGGPWVSSLQQPGPTLRVRLFWLSSSRMGLWS